MNPIPAEFLIGAVRPTSAPEPHHAHAATCSPPAPCRLEGWTLKVEPFRIARFGQTFYSESSLRIDVKALAPGRWCAVAVHNFHVEDIDADLSRARAGVFLASCDRFGNREVPEQFPIECREIGVLAVIEVRGALPPTWSPP
jgi:hypothetical protein